DGVRTRGRQPAMVRVDAGKAARRLDGERSAGVRTPLPVRAGGMTVHRNRSAKLMICVAAAAPVLAASSPAFAQEADALREHRLLWSAAAVDDYEYGYNKFCECHREAPPETLVTVREGEVVGVRHRHPETDTVIEAEQRNLEWYWT